MKGNRKRRKRKIIDGCTENGLLGVMLPLQYTQYIYNGSSSKTTTTKQKNFKRKINNLLKFN